MASVITLKSVENHDGFLSVFEHLMPGSIERAYFIYNVPESSVRGGHRHHHTWQGLICLNGSCQIYVQESEDTDYIVTLDSPQKCLLLKPSDWHQMYEFTEGSILLVLANRNYDPEDYIDTPYNETHVIQKMYNSVNS
ncbi:FdtA/QdtA family cupin domain-containing protein [Leadbetterella sp. DM7]|uniref:sugar 3,4-ketoisomerase n=1 Tax=Leadbetterella sp. DM7 TaxID=3235085 RepID=UPI00349E6FD1